MFLPRKYSFKGYRKWNIRNCVLLIIHYRTGINEPWIICFYLKVIGHWQTLPDPRGSSFLLGSLGDGPVLLWRLFLISFFGPLGPICHFKIEFLFPLSLLFTFQSANLRPKKAPYLNPQKERCPKLKLYWSKVFTTLNNLYVITLILDLIAYILGNFDPSVLDDSLTLVVIKSLFYHCLL